MEDSHEHSKPMTAELQLAATRDSIAQRLAGLQCKRDALLRLALAAEREKGLALQIEQILLADQVPGVTRPPARMYAAQRATFWSCSEA